MSGFASFTRSTYSKYYDDPSSNDVRKVTTGGASDRRSNGYHEDDYTQSRIQWDTIKEGVQIKESDVGQPCTDCSRCLKGFEPHAWRKNCKNCKCERDAHEVVAEHGARSRLGLTNALEVMDSRSLGYTFVPPGLNTARQVDQYYSSLPSQDVPKLGTKGETARIQRLVKQLPKQDLAISACEHVEPAYRSSYQDFISARNEIALDIGMVKTATTEASCAACGQSTGQQLVVVAPRLGRMAWHPACFRCTTCEDLLVDLAYCVHEDKIYCERHYAEMLKPRCSGCDEVSEQL